MRVAIGFMVLTVMWMLSGLVVASFSIEKEEVGYIEQWDGTCEYDAEPSSVSCWDGKEVGKDLVVEEDVWKPNKKEVKIIGRMANGIVKLASKKGGWVICSEKVDVETSALLYAYEVVRAARLVSSDEDGKHWELNAWGLLGTLYNESRLDRCALGSNVRKIAYQRKLLERRKTTVSHTEEEVLLVVRDPKMQRLFGRSGYDIGIAQMLSRFYSDPKDYEHMLSLRGSLEEAAYFMRSHGRRYRTERPWRYWRGSETDWYDVLVVRWAKDMGATDKDI